MPAITIIGNKPIGPNGENEQRPEELADHRSLVEETWSLREISKWYQRNHGKCSSLMITIVDPPED